MVNSFFQKCYATNAASGLKAGATLMPMVMNAQAMAAKSDTAWLRTV
jgi:hypothetical protein